MMLKRLLDLFASIFFLVFTSPLLIIIAFLVKSGSKGPVFYRQERIGRWGKPFRIYKFRTMYLDADKKGLLTVGGRDPRVTSIGYFLRRYKLDELPQFINVLEGSMSIVGPRPEVRKYVEMYNEAQKHVLDVKPGITDFASLQYIDENEILGKASDPEAVYIREIMPAKLKLNLEYIEKQSFLLDLQIIGMTAKRMFIR